MNIILGITGSVATTVVPKLYDALVKAGHSVKVVATDPALYFLPEDFLEDCYMEDVDLYTDKYEWPEGGYHKKDPVKHIEFREWADLLLIAPITANTLAKIANGICDNFLCCIARAWRKEKPLVVAPAMNTEMWEDPITAKHFADLRNRFKLEIVPPVSKVLACGDIGIGAMANIEDIVKVVTSG